MQANKLNDIIGKVEGLIQELDDNIEITKSENVKI